MLIGLFCWIKFFKVRNAAKRLINESIPTIFPSKEKPKPVLKDKQFFNLNIVFLPTVGYTWQND